MRYIKALRGGASRFGVRCWSWLRQVTGDAAYENYLRAWDREAIDERSVQTAAVNGASFRSVRGAMDGRLPLSHEDFYLDALRRRYSTVSRCC